MKDLSTSKLFRKEKKGLGSKLIIALNLSDLLICLFTTGSLVAFHASNRSGEKLAISIGLTDKIRDTIETTIIEDVKNHISLSKTIRMVFYVPFQYFVQSSCSLTVLLSATRMVAMTKPLYIIREKRVWATLLITLTILFGLMIGKWVGLHFMYDIDVSSKTAKTIAEALKTNDYVTNNIHIWKFMTYIQISEYILVILMVFVVMIFSGITVKSLNSPVDIGLQPGGRGDNDQNRRATFMILLLSLAFVLTNGTWIGLFLWMYTEFLNREEPAGRTKIMTFFTLAIMLLNSIINPLIYIARNSELRRYTKQLFMNIVVGFMWIFSNLRMFLSGLIMS